MSCLALSCLVAAAATAAGSAGPAAAVAAAYLGREPIGLRLCLAREACLFVWTASVLAPFGWSLRFDGIVVVKLASHCVFNKIIQNNLKQ